MTSIKIENINNLQVSDQLICEDKIIGNEKNKLLIFDNFFKNPNVLVNLFNESKTLTKSKGNENFYPGVHSPINNEYNKILYNALKPFIKKHFKLPVAYLENIDSDFSVVTTPPDKLNQNQSIPHYDSIGKGRLAILLYLCHPPFKGTGFYRHIETGFESMKKSRTEQYWGIVENQISHNQFENKYINEGNEYYSKIWEAELKFNRLIIYPNQILHSSLIDPLLINNPPINGRLTLRTFLYF
jgi:hypothetical protein